MEKKFQVNLLPQAEEDLQEIVDFIAEERPTVANKMLDKFLQSFSQLALNQETGRKARDKRLYLLGYRYLVVSTYLVFYRIQLKRVFVYRILHGARNYTEIL
ncbi:MAG: type II toxin-antitoxin system RelE/ParE family toxin [Cytophagales bacterium]|nr:type II toxin-antitoxin system RelE/ParE family toxin [Cytophagales bacterium]MCA6365631.1 type II toxin-antitoxin system RelE/ParE family toxin [Cytophagales bacterium]MCA6373422.1 type II toxin-antitoxin system RelE/ParE family toxin [Cytophagales bacterium]MCA6377763.1 type II toxin-antitoxin system RelE/ParE family toxin [Cytophagales bacterium]MCA6383062.1 type II toxin-antitoxin system RelE/ParE family toxin [Cytophagales bacterium]